MAGPDIEALAAWADGRADISHPSYWAKAPGAVRAILAQAHGWEAVRGPGPMTFREAQLSLQLLAEQHLGAPTRAEVYAAKAAEDAAAAAAADAYLAATGG